jgi:hypothetical protein
MTFQKRKRENSAEEVNVARMRWEGFPGYPDLHLTHRVNFALVCYSARPSPSLLVLFVFFRASGVVGRRAGGWGFR